MKEVGNVLVKDGTLIPECTSLDDKTLVSFHDMRVRRIEKVSRYGRVHFCPKVLSHNKLFLCQISLHVSISK